MCCKIYFVSLYSVLLLEQCSLFVFDLMLICFSVITSKEIERIATKTATNCIDKKEIPYYLSRAECNLIRTRNMAT